MPESFQIPKPAVRRSLALTEQQLRLQSLTQYSYSTNQDHVDELDENHLATFVDALSGTDACASNQLTAKKKNSPPIRVGDAVEADYQFMGTYYPAVAIAVDGDTITVQYDEDGIVETLPDDYVVLVAKDGTSPSRKASNNDEDGVGTKWLVMLNRLCEYQKTQGYNVSPDEKELYRWWIKTKKDYILKRKRHRCSMSNEQVYLLEGRAGWSYGYGQVYFPEDKEASTGSAKRDRRYKETASTTTVKRENSSEAQSSRPKRQCTQDVAVKSESKPSRVTPTSTKTDRATKSSRSAAKKKAAPSLVTPERDVRCRNFPDLCHEMIMLVTKQMPHLVSWSKDGKAFFFLTENGEGLEATFEQFFRHSNWKSFQRQLYNYGFEKQHSGSKYEGGFCHPHFRRNSKPMDVAKITRK